MLGLLRHCPNKFHTYGIFPIIGCLYGHGYFSITSYHLTAYRIEDFRHFLCAISLTKNENNNFSGEVWKIISPLLSGGVK